MRPDWTQPNLPASQLWTRHYKKSVAKAVPQGDDKTRTWFAEARAYHPTKQGMSACHIGHLHQELVDAQLEAESLARDLDTWLMGWA